MAIEITTIEDLQKIGNDVAYPLDGDYVLTNNIDASVTATWNSGAGFEPIGDYDNPFTGTFDGKGYSISGLFINRPDDTYVGLFGYEFGTISNIDVENATVVGDLGVGILVGVRLSYTAAITSCKTSGSVSGTSNVGGLVGSNKANISKSCSSATVVATGAFVGGLVGSNSHGTISDCFATGAVTGVDRVGGLVGGNSSGTTENCYSTGVPTGDTNVGGLAGANGTDPPGTISDSYWDTETSGTLTSAGGTGLTTAEMQTASTYSAWDTVSIWSIRPNSYPYLKSIGSNRISAIGLQYYPGCYIDWGQWLGTDLALEGMCSPPAEVYRMLESFASFNKDLHITEFTVPEKPTTGETWRNGYWHTKWGTGFATEQWTAKAQADYIERTYKYAMSHQQCKSVTYWDARDAGGGYNPANTNGGLLTSSLVQKDAAVKVSDVITSCTTNAQLTVTNGVLTLEGYGGVYDVTITLPTGHKETFAVTVREGVDLELLVTVESINMSTLADIEGKVVELSGRKDLENTASLTYAVNAAQRFLDNAIYTEHGDRILVIPIVYSNYALYGRYLKSIKSVHITTSDGTYRLIKVATPEEFIRLYPEFPAGDFGTPVHWVFTTSYNVTAANSSANASLTTTRALNNDCLWFGPTSDASYTLTLAGDFYTEDLVEGADSSYWTVVHPDLLVRATLYQLELASRNTEAAKHWLASISPELAVINNNSMDKSIAEEFEMELNG